MDLDKILCGLQDGEMLILAARPSIGKTALAMNIAAYLAIQQKVPVLVFSLEMDRRQLGTRLMSAHGNVDAYHIRSNTISADEFKRLQVACGSIGDSPLFVDDQPGLTVLQMRARVRKAVIDHGVKLVVLDYLQLMQGPGADLRHRVVDLSLGIKQLARETHLPILCLSQMSRATEGREDHRPMMSDMRESGSLEADADVVLLLHRKGFYDAQKADHEQVNDYNTAELIVAKQRNGPTGVVKLFFDGATTSFKSYADPDKF
jgi:replicative DNA helicase